MESYRIVYFNSIVQGICILFIWNTILISESFFSTSFQNNLENTIFYIVIITQLPNLLSAWTNIFFNITKGLCKYIELYILSLMFFIILFMILIYFEESINNILFMCLSFTGMFLLSGISGLFQNTVYAETSILPPKYTQGIVLGSNLSGCIATVMSIVLYYFKINEKITVILYFGIAITVLIITYVVFNKAVTTRFYTEIHFQNSLSVQPKLSDTQLPITLDLTKITYKEPLSKIQVVKKIKIQLINIFLTMFISLSLFPNILVKIKPVFFTDERSFILFSCFLTFNLGTLVGSVLPRFFKISHQKLIYFVLLRLLFIPLFLICNYVPEIGTNKYVMIQSDVVFTILVFMLAITSGLLSSFSLSNINTIVSSKDAAIAGSFGAAILITGIMSGIAFSYVFPYFVIV